MTPAPVDPATFREALTRFASGITVITTRGPNGEDLGMTVTAFTSLSLDPPLILVCIDRAASMADPLQQATHLGVHVLSAAQESLARRFAEREGDRFAGQPLTRGIAGLPLLEGTLARLQCRIQARHPGGDHMIVVGEVLEAAIGEGEPLLYFRGRYTRLP